MEQYELEDTGEEPGSDKIRLCNKCKFVIDKHHKYCGGCGTKVPGDRGIAPRNCLWCGMRAGIEPFPHKDDYGSDYQVFCLECQCRGPVRSSEEEAIEYWNKLHSYSEVK